MEGGSIVSDRDDPCVGDCTLILMVLPKSFRPKVLVLAHERLGHLGARRVRALLRQRFTWPGMGQDIINYC